MRLARGNYGCVSYVDALIGRLVEEVRMEERRLPPISQSRRLQAGWRAVEKDLSDRAG